MKHLTLLIAFALAASSAHAATAFLKRQYISGQLRVCVYNYYGTEFSKVVPLTEFCPMSIEI